MRWEYFPKHQRHPCNPRLIIPSYYEDISHRGWKAGADQAIAFPAAVRAGGTGGGEAGLPG